MQIIRATLLLYFFTFMPVAWLALLPAAWAESASLTKVATLLIGSQRIQAEVASTPQTRERGLMQRTRLCADCGMLFVFDEAAKHGFWMQNTPLPLSIAFINAQGIIINIADMQPNTTTIHLAQGDALYALEMNRGWFAKRGIKRGDAIRRPQLKSPNKNP